MFAKLVGFWPYLCMIWSMAPKLQLHLLLLILLIVISTIRCCIWSINCIPIHNNMHQVLRWYILFNKPWRVRLICFTLGLDISNNEIGLIIMNVLYFVHLSIFELLYVQGMNLYYFPNFWYSGHTATSYTAIAFSFLASSHNPSLSTWFWE